MQGASNDPLLLKSST